MKTAIKWAATTLARVWEAGKVPLQQVKYLGKAANVSTWTPYGLDSSPPSGQLAILLAILGNPDNQVGLVGSPGEGPELAEGEVVLYHPPTGSMLHLLADGSINIVAGAASALLTAAGGMLLTPGAVPVTVAGDLTVTGILIATGASAALPAVVTSGAKAIGATHTHGGSATAPTGSVSNTGVPT